ncbi:hypothetical protein JCM10295v2_004007 [Rhodotorula toruloides]
MPIEIFLSSSNETTEDEPIIVSDTSDDEPTPPTAIYAADRPRLASRKCAFGASAHPHPHKKKRKLLKSRVPVSSKQERVLTSRRIAKVKNEEGEEERLRGQGLTRRRLTGKHRDPLLEEISFPFSLTLRLEEIRVNLQGAPSRSVVRAALAFRHVTQSAKTALRGPSATASIPLRPYSFGASMTSAALTAPMFLRVVRNPAIPLKPPNPASLDYHPPDNLGELAEVLLLVSISDAAAPSASEPYYSTTVPISKDRRFQLAGERTTKRAADGTQVTLSWTAQFEREGYDYVEPTEEEIEAFVEREMKVVEQEWRREVAERALAAAALEAQEPPVCGPPANLVLDPAAPSPSSIIPGLAETSRPSGMAPSFAPIPRYSYTAFATHGVPLVGNLLETFPFLPTWEDAESTNEQVVAKVQDVLDPPSDIEEEEEEAEEGKEREKQSAIEQQRRKAERQKSKTAQQIKNEDEQRKKLYEFRLATMIDYASFDARDVGRTSRDFEVLRRLLHFLRIDLDELAELETETFRDGAADPRHFAFERSLTPDHVLLKALDVYQRRTGRTVCTVQRDHRLISDEELVPQPDPLDICHLCGAFGCILHANLIAYNRPTKFVKEMPVQHKGGFTSQLMARVQVPMTPIDADLEKEQQLFDLPPIDACTAALILRRPVSDPALFHPPPPAFFPKPRGRRWEHLKLLPIDSEGYVPCACQGKCGDDCSRRYGGCRDHSCSKAEHCWCIDRHRECHPEICGCSASCGNSKIRLHRQKATTVARSQIEQAGYGLVLLEPASQGDFIGLYGGELFPQGMTDEIEAQSVESRWGTWKGAFADLNPVSYWFDVDQSDAIDSALLGSGIRFINHNPKHENVVPQDATKPLKPGDELFMNYGSKYTESWRTDGNT